MVTSGRGPNNIICDHKLINCIKFQLKIIIAIVSHIRIDHIAHNIMN